MTPPAVRPAPLPALINDLLLLAMLVGLTVVLTAALVLQFGFGEAPCPLCLIERIGMFGVAFALVLHVRDGRDPKSLGLGLVFALFLLIVSVRQVLLDIVPRPGHAYVGSTVLGLHMPVWAVLIAVSLLAGFAASLAVFDGGAAEAGRSPLMSRLAGWAALSITALAVINLVAVLAQCGFGACRAGG